MKVIIGRVTRDLEPKVSNSDVHYLNFDVAENVGFGDKAETIFHRCTIFGEEAINRIVKAKVQKGSLLKVVGEQRLGAYIKESTGEPVPTSNVEVWHWEYVPVGFSKSDSAEKADSGGYSDVPSEDCDDGLPE